MIRFCLAALPVAALTACAAPAPQAAAPQAVPMAFDVPMNPGLIRCDQLSNPTALSAASEWALGRARAAVLSGRIDSVPSQAEMGTQLTQSCVSNGRDTVQEAARAIGL